MITKSRVFEKSVKANRRIVAMGVYAAVVLLAYTTAFLLRYEFVIPERMVAVLFATMPLLLGIRLATYWAFGLSTGRWRFIGTGDVLRLVVACVCGTLAFYGLTRFEAYRVSNAIILLEFALTVNLTAGAWIAYRAMFERIRHLQSPMYHNRRRVLIIGAGEAGSMLAREMVRYPTGYKPVAFIDDEPSKLRTYLYGMQVVGNLSELPRIADAMKIDELIIAVPSASPADLRRVVVACEETNLPCKVLPGIAEVLAGDVRLNQLREVRIEDLLGREPIRLELPELVADLAGKTVLITGAAGSIGSELSRQIALHDPARVILFDQAETDLFYLNAELRERFTNLEIHSIIGDIVDHRAVEACFDKYRPDRVYHAAAYKHVPMMETNPFEAARNNIVGTWRVASAAGRHGCGTFILVSTDKAVRPRNYMGATKRIAEMLTLRLQLEHPNTTFGTVRFGNVLGSNGSVIPVFRRQLAAGRPLTVTHPDTTRFFMTIPEAVQLILQASLLDQIRGRIAMLDMGEPVRIADLARNLLRLAGVEEDRIVYCGLRPGEKLHEELVAPDEAALRTPVDKVSLLVSRLETLPDLRPMLAAIEEGQEKIVLQMMSKWFVDLRPVQHVPTPTIALHGRANRQAH